MIWQLFRSLREWWLIKVMGKPKEYVQLLDFFDNPRAPWNASNTASTRLGGTVAKNSNGEQPPSG